MMMKTADDKMAKASKAAAARSKLAPTKSQRPMSREEGRGQAMLDMAARNAGSAPGKGAKPSAPPKAPKPTAKGLAPSKSQRPISRSSGKGMGKYAEGGMVRGCGSASKGKTYSGTY